MCIAKYLTFLSDNADREREYYVHNNQNALIFYSISMTKDQQKFRFRDLHIYFSSQTNIIINDLFVSQVPGTFVLRK